MRFVLPIFSIFLLAACGGDYHKNQYAAPLAQKSIHQSVCLPMQVATLDRTEKAELADMVRHANPLAIDHVALKAGYQHANDRERAENIRALLVEEGVPARVIELVQEPAMPKNVTGVEICYSRAQLMECGDWSGDPSSNFSNSPFADYGCATTNNLAQQVAHPSDLLGTRGNIGIDTQRSLVVMDGYKRNTPIVLVQPTESVTTQTQQ